MRFNEFAPNSSNSVQEGTLATLLRFLLAKVQKPGHEDETVKVPTSVVLNMMNNAGSSFSYEDLEALVDSSDSIKNIIKGPINRKEIEIGNGDNSDGDLDDEDMDQQDDSMEPPMDASQPPMQQPQMQQPMGAQPNPNPGMGAPQSPIAGMASRATSRGI